jgi:hypothetical protein
MGIFGELDVEAAADDPFAVPNNTYRTILTDAKVGPTKAGDKIGMTLTWTIQSEDEHNGKMITEWKHIPTPANPKELTDEEKRTTSFLKKRMLDLGIPPERINSITPDDLIGRECMVSVVNNNGYVNVKKVLLVEEGVAYDENKQFKFS